MKGDGAGGSERMFNFVCKFCTIQKDFSEQSIAEIVVKQLFQGNFRTLQLLHVILMAKFGHMALILGYTAVRLLS